MNNSDTIPATKTYSLLKTWGEGGLERGAFFAEVEYSFVTVQQEPVWKKWYAFSVNDREVEGWQEGKAQPCLNIQYNIPVAVKRLNSMKQPVETIETKKRLKIPGTEEFGDFKWLDINKLSGATDVKSLARAST